jgi:rhamnose utilization protein RhaD (predicted bifunctional aldolase and dehydrogenase)
MSQTLGDPTNDYVILGEGNTSVKIDQDTFLVKASGTHLGSIDESGFVEVWFEGVLSLLQEGTLTNQEIRARLEAARADRECDLLPSVETVLHAVALNSGAARFVGHTHPTAVNMILCSERAEESVRGRLFPEEIVICGPAPAFVPYTDPGLSLGREVWASMQRHADRYGDWPKVMLLQNHGLIAFGQSAQEVLDITSMAVKSARVLLGTYTLGGPYFLPASEVSRLSARPDEEYRRRVLWTPHT